MAVQASSSSSTTNATPMLCPLCAEVMVEESSTLPVHSMNPESRRHRRMLGRPCCGQSICQSCMYRHIRSVWDEGMTGNGRKQVVCPMGCGRPILDADIRSCLHRQHAHGLWNWIGGKVLNCLLWLRWFICCQDPMQTSLYYEYWLYFTTTAEERRDLHRYEQWSLAMALRSMSSSIQRCPAPDCDYAWQIANPQHRQAKIKHDRKPVYLWYKPPPPEPSLQNVNSSDTPAARAGWVQAAYVKTLHGGPPPLNDELIQEEMARDGRFMICAKCHTTFCGLCRRPWNDVSTSHRRRFSHAGVSCATYRHRNPPDDDGYAFVSQVADARMCPGCSVRTSRTEGCNHMTCPCGVEWCYICERSWSWSHYGCVDRPASATSAGAPVRPILIDQCVIL